MVGYIVEDQTIENGVKKPDPVDIHVGSRLRLRRMMLGISQEKLGDNLGLTFQQIQKYEKGTNRIGASRLFQLSKILEVNVQFFFDEIVLDNGNQENQTENQGKQEDQILDFLNSREGLDLNRAFTQISDHTVRRRVIDLLKSIAKQDD